MEITVQLPDDLLKRADPQREAVEAVAIAGYKAGVLTAYQARIILRMDSRFQFEAFLKERNILEHSYSEEDLEQDLRTLEYLKEHRKESSVR